MLHQKAVAPAPIISAITVHPETHFLTPNWEHPSVQAVNIITTAAAPLAEDITQEAVVVILAVRLEHSATAAQDPAATGAQAPLQILPQAVVREAAQAAVQPPSDLFQEEATDKRIYTKALESV